MFGGVINRLKIGKSPENIWKCPDGHKLVCGVRYIGDTYPHDNPRQFTKSQLDSVDCGMVLTCPYPCILRDYFSPDGPGRYLPPEELLSSENIAAVESKYDNRRVGVVSNLGKSLMAGWEIYSRQAISADNNPASFAVILNLL